MNFLKTVAAVVAFVLARRAQIEGFITDAETVFPAAGSGLLKLQYVLGRIFTYAQDAEDELAKLPPDTVAAMLSGHISQIVAKLFPQPPPLKAGT